MEPKSHLFEIMSIERTECGMTVRDHTRVVTRFQNRAETRQMFRSFGSRFCRNCTKHFEGVN